jgi:hypothetical protein
VIEDENLRRARLLVDEHGLNFDIGQELLAFIRCPELRVVAERVFELHRCFASTTVLRKLLEADEALARTLAIHVVLEANLELKPHCICEQAPGTRDDVTPGDHHGKHCPLRKVAE